MRSTLISSVLGFAFVCTSVTSATPTSAAGGAAQAAKRTVYVSVVDKNGSPVTDMQAADFEVKEGGKTQEIVSVKEAAVPLRIALIDSDAGYGAYQAGLLQFMQKLLGRAEFALTSVIVQPEKVFDYSSDPAALSKGLGSVGRRGVQRGAQLLEAIMDAAKGVRAEGKRAIIVVMRVGGEGTSTLSGNIVREQIRKSGATLYAVSIQGLDRTPTSSGGGASMDATTQASQLHDDEANEGATNLQQVLGDGTRESGGHYDQVVSTGLAKALEQLGDELLHQYEITYALPAGAKPGDKLAVSSKRKGVTVRAPARVPE
jgi:VWFA-related protein